MFTVSDSAIEQIKEMADGELLRVMVDSGGCTGFQYNFSMTSKTTETDTIVDGVVIDHISLPYVKDSVIDYSTDPFNKKFIITNPSATATCGCGESFSV